MYFSSEFNEMSHQILKFSLVCSVYCVPQQRNDILLNLLLKSTKYTPRKCILNVETWIEEWS